jgi:hypothetical protein
MSYSAEFIAVSTFMAILLFLLVTPLALVAIAIVLFAASAILLGVVAAVIAAPIMLLRAALRRRPRGRQQRAEDPAYPVRATVTRAS